MTAINRDHVRFARAVLLAFALEGRILWREYNRLMSDVHWHWMRLHGCEGKKVYGTFAHAKHVAEKPNREGEARVPYPCKVCHKYHVASVDPYTRKVKRVERETKAWLAEKVDAKV